MEKEEVEEPEPLLLTIVMAPFRLVKGLLAWVFKKIIGLSPALEYMLEQRERDRQEMMKETAELAAATKELERRLEKIEKE